MDTDREQQRRLMLAYFMGELEGEERRRAESEIARDPAEAKRCRKLVEELRAWGREPVDAPPLRLEELGLAETPESADETRARHDRRRAGVGRWAWALAAAALLVFAISQASFTLQLGNATLRWGAPARAAAAAVAGFETRVNRIEQSSSSSAARIEQVALRQAALEQTFQQTTTQLVQLQQLESQTRYRDMQSLMQLAAVRY